MIKVVESISDRRLITAQNKILTNPPLKIEGTNPQSYGTKRRALRSVLLDILQRVKVKHTIYVNPTPAQTNCMRDVQCYSGRRRSQGDLFLMLRYYRPDVTFKEFRGALFQLVNEKLITTSYCSTINKRVFLAIHSRRTKPYLPNESWPYPWAGIYGQNAKDEFGFTLKTVTE